MFNTVMLFGTLTGILLGVGWFFAGFIGAALGLALALLINLGSYWYSDRIVLKLYKASLAKEPALDSIIKRLSREAQIPVPKLYITQAGVPNALATGRSPKKAAIVLTKGLLNFDLEEIEGVLAHEIAHIRNRDMVVATMAATIAGAISYIAHIGYWSMFMGGKKGEGGLMGLIFIIIFAPIAALLVRMAISRNMEYRADWVGVSFSKKPKALASALRKISDRAIKYPFQGSSATSHLWIVNPFHRNWFTNLFSTHPPIQKRIERLEHMASL